MTRIVFLLAAILATSGLCSGLALAKGRPVLPEGTPIRVMDAGLGDGWHEGRIGTAGPGCTMVFLNKKSKTGYTSVSFAGQRQLQMQATKNGAWVDVPVKELNPKQPKVCQDGGDND
jgi:hypothetical protein